MWGDGLGFSDRFRADDVDDLDEGDAGECSLKVLVGAIGEGVAELDGVGAQDALLVDDFPDRLAAGEQEG